MGIPEGRGKINGWFPYGKSGPDQNLKLVATFKIISYLFGSN